MPVECRTTQGLHKHLIVVVFLTECLTVLCLHAVTCNPFHVYDCHLSVLKLFVLGQRMVSQVPHPRSQGLGLVHNTSSSFLSCLPFLLTPPPSLYFLPLTPLFPFLCLLHLPVNLQQLPLYLYSVLSFRFKVKLTSSKSVLR